MLGYKVSLKRRGRQLPYPALRAARKPSLHGRRLFPGARPIIAWLLIAAIGLILAPGLHASPQGPRPGGNPLWLDSPGGVQANLVVVTGGRVLAVGQGTSQAYYHHFMVRALDPATGKVLWQDNLNASFSEAVAVAATGTRVVAAGNKDDGETWLVRAYNAFTGAVLWTDSYALGNATNEARAVTIIGGKAIVAGNCDTAGHRKLVVRAYNLDHGNLLWSDIYDLGGGYQEVHGIASLASRLIKTKVTQFVAVAGKARTTDGLHDRWLVRTYNARTGTFLWQDSLVPPLVGTSSDAKAIIAGNSKFYVVGSSAWIFGPAEWVVRAYSPKDGQIKWQDWLAFTGNTVADHVTIYGTKLFVGGYAVSLTNDQHTTALVRAYKTADGGVLWDNSIDIAGSLNLISGMATIYGRVFVGGVFINTPGAFFDKLDWFLNSYDQSTGAEWWWKTWDRFGSADWMYGLAASNGRVFGAGANVDTNNNWHWAVRAYSDH